MLYHSKEVEEIRYFVQRSELIGNKAVIWMLLLVQGQLLKMINS